MTFFQLPRGVIIFGLLEALLSVVYRKPAHEELQMKGAMEVFVLDNASKS